MVGCLWIRVLCVSGYVVREHGISIERFLKIILLWLFQDHNINSMYLDVFLFISRQHGYARFARRPIFFLRLINLVSTHQSGSANVKKVVLMV